MSCCTLPHLGLSNRTNRRSLGKRRVRLKKILVWTVTLHLLNDKTVFKKGKCKPTQTCQHCWMSLHPGSSWCYNLEIVHEKHTWRMNSKTSVSISNEVRDILSIFTAVVGRICSQCLIRTDQSNTVLILAAFTSLLHFSWGYKWVLKRQLSVAVLISFRLIQNVSLKINCNDS